MPRAPTGTIKWMRNKKTGRMQWHARFSRGPGAKPRRTPYIAIDANIPEHDRVAAQANAAKWVPEARAPKPGGTGETVAEYAGRWLDDREGRIASIAADRARMRMHVLPILGPLDVRALDRDDVEALRDALDKKITMGALAWKTVASCWTLVTSMCADMMSAKRREFRVRTDNPCRDVKPPELGDKKAKQYLYPSEFLRFVSCATVPLRLRRGAAIAVYTFVRDGELRELRWDGGDFDLEHGTLSITRAVTRTGVVKSTKSGETRRFAVEPNILPLLRAMHTEAGGKGPVVTFKDRHMSRDLRLWLTRAGVTRPELHKGDAHRKPLTWHDLRATGLTWLAVRGDDPLKIKQRAGHSTFSTTEGYIREAEAIRDGFGEVFPPLPFNCHPIAILPSGIANRAKNKGKTVEALGIERGRESAGNPTNTAIPAIDVETQLPVLDVASEREAEKTAVPVVPVRADRMADLEAAIGRLTRALSTAEDTAIPGFVAERAQMRDELRALRETGAGNVVSIRRG